MASDTASSVQKRLLAEEDYWPFVVSSFLFGSLLLTVIYVFLNIPEDFSIGRRLCIALLNSGSFVYLFSKDLRFQPARLFKVVLYFAVLSAFISVIHGQMTLFVIFLPGGFLGYPLLYGCGWLGAKVASVFGYQRHIRPKLAERAMQEQNAQQREKELKDWLRSSFLEWKQGWLGKEFPHILQITEKFKSPEDYVKAICENSYARNALGPIRNATSFGSDEILLEISDRFMFTTHRLYIFTRRRLNPAILEHTIPLEDITSYERDVDTGQIVIHKRDGNVVSLICRHGVPRKDMMTRLIELRTARQNTPCPVDGVKN